MNQGKLEVVKQEMARVNVNILGLSKLKWTGMGECDSEELYIYYCSLESIRRNGVAIIFNETKPCRVGATQDGQVMVQRSDRMWSIGEGNGKPLQYCCLENPMKSMKRQKDRTWKDELPRSVGAQYCTVEQWRNNSRKNEETELK